jgi:hypothetical protein
LSQDYKVSLNLECAATSCLHRITLELRDRQAKVDVLHAKFEMLASRAHGTDAEGGEPKSQAYYIVKVRCPKCRWSEAHTTV